MTRSLSRPDRRSSVLQYHAHRAHENGRDCRYISITFHPRLLYILGSRIASRYTDPLMENAALLAVCFDLSHLLNGTGSGRVEHIRIDSLRDTYEWTSRWTCSVSGNFYTFTAALTGNRHMAGGEPGTDSSMPPSSMKTISLILDDISATSISAKAKAAGSLRVT